TTSDHYPVLSRFAFNVAPPPPPPPPPLRITSPNGGEQLASGTVQTLTWTVPPVPATTVQARVRVSDASAPATSDQSDTAFTVSWPPPVFINEYLPHEPPVPGGTARDFAQQFVEVVNGSTSTVDLGGWLVNDRTGYTGTAPRHVFAAGTLLEPGRSFVVYSGASAIPAGATNAVAASSGGLFFNKGTGTNGDDVYLQNGAKQVVDSTSYTESTEAISYNRSPDAVRTGAFELHNLLNPGLGSSPGRRADGGNF
ncbi:MAG TPA: lamin tail domain-containing protein, partial [Archangium sp.]|nr:lamin tail domain-containing protein [Archangium sp.]